MFKKKLLSFLILFIFAVSMLTAVGSASAVTAGDLNKTIRGDSANGLNEVAGGVYGSRATDTYGLEEMIVLIINAILGLLGIIFLVLTLYAGFLWMMAAGNEDQVGKAKNILTAAIIGIIIIVAAYAITNFVLTAILKTA